MSDARDNAGLHPLGSDRAQHAARVASRLRRGDIVTDMSFDRLLPEAWRSQSDHFWTPVEVALRAAQWIDQIGAAHVVDIGSGAGKFCVVGALASRARFTGVEHRRSLIQAAEMLARELNVHGRVSFRHEAIAPGEVPAADVYYLFNPFGENFYGPDESLDTEVELSDVRFARDVETVKTTLRAAPLGTHLLTYNGFGGTVPSGYAECRLDRELPCVLRLSVKTAECCPRAPRSIFQPGRR